MNSAQMLISLAAMILLATVIFNANINSLTNKSKIGDATDYNGKLFKVAGGDLLDIRLKFIDDEV